MFVVALLAALPLAFASVPEAGAAQSISTQLQRVNATDVRDPVDGKLLIDGLDDKRVDVDVAVLDTGVNLDHPDLNVVAGADCIGAVSPTYACTTGPGAGDDETVHTHGTRVAEALTALDNDFGWEEGGAAAVGAAPGARVWSVKVWDRDDAFVPIAAANQKWANEEPWDPVPVDLDPMIAGVEWVTAHADEIEILHFAAYCSVGTQPALPTWVCDDDGGQVEELEAAIEEAIEAGLVVVTPAGNWHEEADSPAAAVPGTIVVSAMFDSDGLPGGLGPSTAGCNIFFPAEQDDRSANSSHYGPRIDVAAPGPCTSQSATYVSGAAAILASAAAYPTDDEGDVEAIGDAIFGGGDCAKPSVNDPDVGAGNCLWSDDSGDGIQEPLVDLSDEAVFAPETVQGAAWIVKAVPNAPTTTVNRLTGVSCTSSTFCMASGYAVTGGVSIAYARTWDGSAWASVGGVPPAENSGVELSDVSCTSSTACTAVGSETEENGDVLAFAARWDGTKWARQSVPNAPTTTVNRLTGVSCTSSTFCMASGSAVQQGTSVAYARTWNGSAWASVGENSGVELSDVSCTSSTACTAVGSQAVGNDALSLVLGWNGASWAREETSDVAGATENRLVGVSCASSCVSVGRYVDGSGTWNLAEHAP